MVEILDTQVWLGWLMIAALLYSGIPPIIFGRLKQPLSAELHDKVLFADARMNRADWLTASAAIAGVVGIGFGLWWADSAAAALISLDILKDGAQNLRRAVADLMDETPTTVDRDATDPVRDELLSMLKGLDWVEGAEVRLREVGQVYFGEAFVVSSDSANLTQNIEDASKKARALDWRVQDLVIMPVRKLPDQGG
jgi:divalent metal cation (Fe/Co/Zn/Cd) transporter